VKVSSPEIKDSLRESTVFIGEEDST